MIRPDLLAELRCPINPSQTKLILDGDRLRCERCALGFKIRDGFPNMIGVKQGETEDKVRRLLPGYMAMGETGMDEMTDMNIGGPKNTLPMMAGQGAYGPVGMGGMFTVVRVRAGIKSYQDPGPYKSPPGTAAHKVAMP